MLSKGGIMRKDPYSLRALEERIEYSRPSPEFIRIAKRAKNHSEAYGTASRLAYQKGLPSLQAIACSHLFTIRKKFGKKVFNKVIRNLRAKATI